jgi:hypothetical protein
MQIRSIAKSLVLAAAFAASACTTGNGRDEAKEPVQPPTIAPDMPLDKALEAGIDFGGETLHDVKRLVKRRHQEAKAGPILLDNLKEGVQSYEHHQLMNSVALFMSTPTPLPVEMFETLITSGRPLATQLGWQLAAAKPSRALAVAIDKELTRAVDDDDIDSVLLPQMANAVASHKLKGSYTMLRRGLMTKGDEEFAQAMIALDPNRSSEDFLAYLAQAPAEELRQLTVSSVNIYTAIAILQHFKTRPPTVAAADFGTLFLYAVSRNTGLAELAQAVIEGYVPQQTELLAQVLAQHPVWVQIAYLESARRQMNPKVGLLLGELKKASAERDVVEEIDEIKL